MLESIFIMIIAAGFIFFILTIELESIMYSAVSLLMWIITLAGQVYVEVPSDTYYDEPAFFGVALGMILLNVIWLIIMFMKDKEQQKAPMNRFK